MWGSRSTPSDGSVPTSRKRSPNRTASRWRTIDPVARTSISSFTKPRFARALTMFCEPKKATVPSTTTILRWLRKSKRAALGPHSRGGAKARGQALESTARGNGVHEHAHGHPAFCCLFERLGDRPADLVVLEDVEQHVHVPPRIFDFADDPRDRGVVLRQK